MKFTEKVYSSTILSFFILFYIVNVTAQNKSSQNELSFSSPYLFSFPKTSNISVSRLDTNKFVIAFRNDGYGGKGVSIIGEISDGNVIFGPPEFFDEGVVGEVKVQGLSPSKFIIAWQDEKHADIGKTIVGEVNYNFISYADSYVFNDKPAGNISIVAFNNYDCVLGFTDGGNSFKGTIKRIKVIGNYVTMMNKVVFSDGQPGFISPVKLSDTTFAISWDDTSDNVVNMGFGRITFDSVFFIDEQIILGDNPDRFVSTHLFENKFSFSWIVQGNEMTNTGIRFPNVFSLGKVDTILTGNIKNILTSPLNANHYLHIANFENDSAFAGVATVSGTVQKSSLQQSFAKEISNLSLATLSPERFIIAFSDDANNNSGKLVLGNISFLTGHYFDIKAILEGPFSGVEMNSNTGMIPESQPYFEEPSDYFGDEYLSFIPDTIVDWLLLEVRETAGDASTATSSKSIFRQAVFVSNGGSVLSSDAISIPFAEFYQNENIFVVISHRNHLDIMSAYPLVDINGTFEFDFTESSSKIYGGLNGCSQLNSSTFGMAAGDADGNGKTDNADKNNIWINQLGGTGYLDSDLNIDGIVDFNDKLIFWNLNSGKSSQLPE